MGQLVSVREKYSSSPGVVRFEINRSLTGMGHERYSSLDDILRDRPVDLVARRLFEHGGVSAVHVNSSVITVHLSPGSQGEGIAEVIEHLFKFYDEDGPIDDGRAEDAPAEESSDIEGDAGEVDGDVPEA